MEELLKCFPRVRVATVTTGCAEVDACAPRIRLFFTGEYVKAEHDAETFARYATEHGVRVTQHGPRDLEVDMHPDFVQTHVTPVHASF